VIRKPLKAVDERLGVAGPLRSALRYVFPEHWSFMLGEIALYAFAVLVVTGIYLTLFYVPSDHTTVYSGSYVPLQGRQMGEQYASVLRIVFDIPAGNLVRQTHHWAANVFVAAIVLHLLRVVLTGAFRKPRELNYFVGVAMAGLAIFEGFAGYSLIDDLLSGMGLVIAYSVAIGLPLLGTPFAVLVWGGPFPGTHEFWPRLEIVHVLVVPVILAGLMGLHLLQITRQHHTQFAGPGRTERRAIGVPAWPGYALRSLSLLFATAGVLVLLGALVQINPVWEWGPFDPYLSSNGAQPDWYLGWLIGALRMMPNWELHIGGYTLISNPVFGGFLFPTFVFAVLFAIPAIDRRFFGDRLAHNVLDRPRDNPRRTAWALAFLSWVFTVFAAGSADRFFLAADISYELQIWLYRAACIVVPLAVFFTARHICRRLAAGDDHPLRGWTGSVVTRDERAVTRRRDVV
jgi:ubiquinol-cytochrome c reductase cytochrome b subunit